MISSGVPFVPKDSSGIAYRRLQEKVPSTSEIRPAISPIFFFFDFLQKLLGFLQKFFALFGTPVRASAGLHPKSRLEFLQDFLLGYFEQFLQKILFLLSL